VHRCPPRNGMAILANRFQGGHEAFVRGWLGREPVSLVALVAQDYAKVTECTSLSR